MRSALSCRSTNQLPKLTAGVRFKDTIDVIQLPETHAVRSPRHQNDAELQGRRTHSVPEPHRTRKPVYEHNVPHHHLHVD